MDHLDGMTQEKWNRLSETERHELRDFSPHPMLEDARMHRCRVEITFGDGSKMRGYVGLTTGWRPVYLLLHNARSVSSSVTLEGARLAAIRSVRRTYPIRRR